MMIFRIAFLLISAFCLGESIDLEKECLSNIEQITFPSMGFEKAGESYFSPDDKLLIFQAVPIGETGYQMYVLDLQTRSWECVSTGKGTCTCGFFKPDGGQILFASSHENEIEREKTISIPGKYVWDFTPYMNIYRANIDGTNLQKITSGAAYHAECSYSPDGSQIVYASNEDGSMNLYICKEDGSKKKQITFSKNCYNGGPFFSPDGQWILFRADREKKDYLQIYKIRVDGTEEMQLTNDEAVNWAPFWYPNGEIIAYTTSKHGHFAYEIYLLDIKKLVEHRLTYSLNFNGLPSFNKDGSKITWTSKRGDGTSQVFIADFSLPKSMR